MMAPGEQVVRAARRRIGVRFRPQGRGADGLDCVGLAVAAYGAALSGPVPADYAQRGGSAALIAELIAATGLVAVPAGQAEPGDLLLIGTGPAQWHLAIRSDTGFVHADARLRRVVETPGWPHWPVDGAWRLKGDR